MQVQEQVQVQGSPILTWHFMHRGWKKLLLTWNTGVIQLQASGH